ncbi:MAG: cysteine--tRNA ligase, partial [Candidatus Kapaibacteriota bacterium]
MQIKLYNSISKQIEVLKPIGDNINNHTIRIYSCGPTVYNYAHIGNLRSFLAVDLMQRVIRTLGEFDVKWVMNITDIDDKTIKGAAIGGDGWRTEMGKQTADSKVNLKKFTEFYAKEFLNDIGAVGIKKEHFYEIPRATNYIAEMQDLVRKIFENGFAYVSDGSVYFSISKWREKAKYGYLKKIDFENFVVGERVDSDEYEKEEAFDFVLWKFKKEGEPYWEFELDGQNCDGRPGWHLECSAMEKHILGLPFEIHTGGVDLCFPHHEDEIAQSTAGYGIEPTQYWCHNEFLEVEGKKMSKSLGNFYTIKDLVEKGIDPKDVRFAMLSAHYRSIYNFTFADVESSRKGRIRIQEYIYSVWDKLDGNEVNSEIDYTTVIGKLILDVWENLTNDFHTPKGLAATYKIINNVKVSELSEIDLLNLAGFFVKFNAIFGVFELTTTPEVKLEIPAEVELLAKERFEAKLGKNWALS